MPSNYGKAFEERLKEDWMKMDGATIDRLYDPVGGYVGVTNICDFIGYKFPFIVYVECKSVKGNTFPFSNFKQFNKLICKKGIKGVLAGVVVWFYEKDVVLWCPIEEAERMINDGEKSINCKKVIEGTYNNRYNIKIIPSKKKRVFMESDYSVLFDCDYKEIVDGN